MYGLLTDSELFDDSTVSFNIVFLQISQKVSSVTYHFKKAAVRMAILRVNLKVSVKLVDSGGEKSYLHLRRTGVSLMNGIIGNNLLLLIFCHFFTPFTYSPQTGRKVTVNPFRADALCAVYGSLIIISRQYKIVKHFFQLIFRFFYTVPATLRRLSVSSSAFCAQQCSI